MIHRGGDRRAGIQSDEREKEMVKLGSWVFRKPGANRRSAPLKNWLRRDQSAMCVRPEQVGG